MPLKHELAWLVQERLEQMGLLPARLAELAQVPTERVVALLARADPEINIAEAEQIANTVGLSLGVFGHQRSRNRTDAFVSAAREASTSFAISIPADAVRDALLSGVVTQNTVRTSVCYLTRYLWACLRQWRTSCKKNWVCLSRRVGVLCAYSRQDSRVLANYGSECQ